LWEISIKVGLSKLRLSLPYRDWMEKAITDLGLTLLPISLDHAATQSTLAFHHRDPFDRLLIAQALVEGLSLVSSDGVFDQYGVTRLW
jgi:PIN domain nuclease of toxin-antitoxin system